MEKINIRTKHRFKESDSDTSLTKRRAHKVYLNEKEWEIILRKSAHLNREPSVYGREVMLGYKPIVPDPEFRHGLMRAEDDIRKLFAFLKGLNYPQEERYQYMCVERFLEHWTDAVEKILIFLDMWIKRV